MVTWNEVWVNRMARSGKGGSSIWDMVGWLDLIAELKVPPSVSEVTRG